MIKTDVLVIGAGPAGSTAARFAAKGGAKVKNMAGPGVGVEVPPHGGRRQPRPKAALP